MGRTRSTLALVLLVGFGSVVVVLGTSHAGQAEGHPALHGAVEAVIASVAALAAFLSGVRAYATRRLDDFVLAAAIGLLATSQIAFSMLPAALSAGSQAWPWAASAARLLGAVMLAAAALVPQLRVERPRAVVIGLGAACVAAFVVITVAFAVSASALPAAVTPSGELEGRAAVYAIQIATFLAFAVAAVGFAVRWTRGHGRVDELLATATGLAAIARFDYLLDSTAGLPSARAGDLLRVLFYMLIVLALERDAARRAAAQAVLRERRRIARDLHDGLAQDLAFIVRRARTVDDDGELAAAAERALAESRRAITALRLPSTEPLDVTLAAALDGLATRVGTRLVLDLAPVSGVSSDQREALIAIAHEAVANAGRHASAGVVRVELSEDGHVHLRVCDDGVGFETRKVRGDRYGIAGMRERAEAIGASFHLSSSVGEGTEVEVVLQ